MLIYIYREREREKERGRERERQRGRESMEVCFWFNALMYSKNEMA
jgi:hypothetical protein